MKTRFSRGLVIAAAIAILPLGCSSDRATAQPAPPPAEVQNQADVGQPADVLPPDIASNAPLAEVIRLSQAAVSEEVISNYVGNSSVRFNLTANQIIYLKDIGVPDSVVMAMIQRDQQLGNVVATPPPQAAPAPPPAPTVVTETYFYDSLAPYGSWVYVEGYGRCWRPSVVAYDSNWRPYCDHGHWVYTDSGWYWYSDYSWGWAPFHYGRWFLDARFGWCWWPDTVWAPSWVCWRYSNDYCGWAPLPPRSYYRPGIGLVYNGVTVSAGFSFGFSAGFFTFVSTSHFCDPHPWRYRAPHDQVTTIYNNTTTINNITVVNNGNGNQTTIVNNGIPPEHITTVTHAPVHPVHIRETTTPVRRGEAVDRDGTLVVNRPRFDQHEPANDDHPHTIPSPTTGAPMQVPPERHGNDQGGRPAGRGRNFSQTGSTPAPSPTTGESGSVLPQMPASNDNADRQPHRNQPDHPLRTVPIVTTPPANNGGGNEPSQPAVQQPAPSPDQLDRTPRNNPADHSRHQGPVIVSPSGGAVSEPQQPVQTSPSAPVESQPNNPVRRQPLTSPRGGQPPRSSYPSVNNSPSAPATVSPPPSAPAQPAQQPAPSQPHYGSPYSSPRSASPPPSSQSPPPGYGGNTAGNGQGNSQGNSDHSSRWDKDKNGR
ncbi:MAG TPA: DUF6600 domain-containing protein [Desulfuromonadaceae bacterium]|nr:DUF6600 domain-containing protein [Desulfuromonadaceae bacterium]